MQPPGYIMVQKWLMGMVFQQPTRDAPIRHDESAGPTKNQPFSKPERNDHEECVLEKVIDSVDL